MKHRYWFEVGILLNALAGCGDETQGGTVCDQAATHVKSCTGVTILGAAAACASKTESASAQQVEGLSCSTLSTGVKFLLSTNTKSDGAHFRCGGWGRGGNANGGGPGANGFGQDQGPYPGPDQGGFGQDQQYPGPDQGGFGQDQQYPGPDQGGYPSDTQYPSNGGTGLVLAPSQFFGQGGQFSCRGFDQGMDPNAFPDAAASSGFTGYDPPDDGSGSGAPSGSGPFSTLLASCTGNNFGNPNVDVAPNGSGSLPPSSYPVAGAPNVPSAPTGYPGSTY